MRKTDRLNVRLDEQSQEYWTQLQARYPGKKDSAITRNLIAMAALLYEDAETWALLRKKYPHKTDLDIMRELLFHWRLRHDEENTKERKLDMILRLCFEILREVEGEGLSAELEDFRRWWRTERVQATE